MKYLFIGAHVDDVELCCGGTVSKIIEQGHDVTIVTLSQIYGGVCLAGEWRLSMEVLNPRYSHVHDFQTRNFYLRRQEILDYLLTLKGHDFVFTDSPNDIHQDHSTVGIESLRAFKNTNLITYSGGWNHRIEVQNYFVVLEKHHIEKKIEALSCYKSQLDKPYIHSDYIYANVLNNGVSCGVKYAEVFNAINIIV